MIQDFIEMATYSFDTLLQRAETNNNLIESIDVVVNTWTDDREALRGQIAALQQQLAASNDGNPDPAVVQAVDQLMTKFDENDALLNGIKTRLSGAVVANTPAEGIVDQPATTDTQSATADTQSDTAQPDISTNEPQASADPQPDQGTDPNPQ